MATAKASGAGAALTQAQVVKMKSLGIEFSEDAEERHLKILMWGATSTRKTETVLRNFPGVLIIDAEGNTDQCVKNKAIPPFQRVKTQDSRKVLEILDAAASGLIRMPDGAPVQTICIDSISVIWSIQQEVASSLAEQRAARKGRAIDEATTTQLDWGRAKRPLKSVMNRFSKTAIPFLVLIAREKPLYEEMAGGDLKKIGVTPNVVRDTEYDMNLALHFTMDGAWGYEVTKVQGGLSEIFPLGGRGKTLPLDKLFEYASKLKPEAEETDNNEDENLADRIASSMVDDQIKRTQSNLIKYAFDKGINATGLGQVLKDAGFSGFDPTRWDEMIQKVNEAAETTATAA